MKKLFLFIAAALVSTGIWATGVTIGMTNPLSTTSKKGGPETVSGATNLTVARVASLGSDTVVAYSTGDKAMYYGSSTSQYSTSAYNIKKSFNTFRATDYIGYSVTVANGYVYSLTNLTASIAASANFSWKVEITNSSGTVLYKTDDLTISDYNKSTASNYSVNTDLSTTTKVQGLTGTFYVKAYFYFTSTGKYFCFPQIQITGNLAQTQAHTVTYKINNGTETADVVESASLVGANPFTYEGYRFMSWNTQADGKGTTYAVGALVTDDLILFAQWAQLFSVTYSANGASGTAPTEAQHIQGETFDVADQGSLETPSGKAFGGWTYNTNTYAAGDEFEMPSSNVEFVAYWVDTYTVTYKANGGTGDDINVNSPATIADCSFTAPANKEFLKWNTAANGTGSSYAPGDAINTDVTLYAQWITSAATLFDWTSKNTKDITTDNTDLSGEDYGTLTTGTSVTGHIFETVSSTKIEKSSSGYKILNDTTCIEIQGTVAFEAGDTVIITGKGGGSGNRCFVIASASAELATDASGIQTNMIDGQVENAVYKAVITDTQAGEKLRIFRLTGKNIYCKKIKVKRPAKYNVIFTAGEGSGSMSSLEYTQGVEVTLPSCSFTAPGNKIFDAWTSTDVTIAENKFTMPADNVVVTATWKNGTPTILDNTIDEIKATKMIRNGQMYIQKDGKIYNVMGMEIR